MAVIPSSDDALREALDRFEQALRSAWKPGATVAGDLVTEARPVLEALDVAVPIASDDPTSIEAREALALAGLLGRRVADHHGSPRLAVHVGEALFAALTALGRPAGPRLGSAISTALVEGYCAAREDRIRSEIGRRTASRVEAVPIAPGCWAVFVGGEPDVDTLERALDRAGRRLLDGGARACWVHVTVGEEASDEVARALGGFAESGRLVGAAVVVSGASGTMRDALAASAVVVEDSPDRALSSALAAAGVALRDATALMTRIRRLWTPAAR